MPVVNEVCTGVVRWFQDAKGYGFIAMENGADVFVHYSEIQRPGFRSLREGQKVTFTCVETAKGKQAKAVTLVR